LAKGGGEEANKRRTEEIHSDEFHNILSSENNITIVI
jgi:hypothetical protein